MSMFEEGKYLMRSEMGKLRRPLLSEELDFVARDRPKGRVTEVLKLPLDERRKEALKPLYLVRYE